MSPPVVKTDEPVLDEVESNRMPLLAHLKELRTRLMWSTACLFVGMGVSLVFAEEIFLFLKAPFDAALIAAEVEGGLAIVNSPLEGVYTYFRIAFFGGIVLSLPMIAFQIWMFVAPGLYSSEKKVVIPLALTSTVLFLAGAGFCYYTIFPYAFPFFLQVLEAEANVSMAGYLSAITRIMGAFGVCFQLPVVVFFLARMGLVDHRDLVNSFRYAVVAIFVVAAIITPPDILTQSLLAAPLIVLYGVSIGVAWLFTTKVREA